MKAARRGVVRVFPMLSALVLLAVASAPVSAQRVTESRWAMQDARGGFCIWYLVDPATAATIAPRGTVFSPAGTGNNLPAQLRQTIRDEPRFINWIPAAICVDLYQVVTIDGEKPINAQAEEPIALVSHLISASSPQGNGGATFLLIKLSSNNRVVRKQGGDRGLNISNIDVVAGKDRGTAEDRVELKLEKTVITWIGHPTGDQGVETTRSMSFGYAGGRSTSWLGRLVTAPAETHPMVGSLRVEGKSPLAKALVSSPIRPTGPIETGGSASFLFQISPSGGSTRN